jgi:hypothetical protein
MIELKPSQETASNKVKPSINSNEDKLLGAPLLKALVVVRHKSH